MSAAITRSPGHFTWHELYSRSPRSSASFYSALLGWRFETVRRKGFVGGDPAERPMVMRQGAEYRGGMTPLSTVSAPLTPQWVGYVSCDVDQAAELAAQNGGAVYVPPENTPNGRMALVADPEQLFTAPWCSIDGDRLPGERITHGEILWAQLLTQNVEQAAAFYGAVYGWKLRDGIFHSEEAPIAACIETDGAPRWRFIVATQSLDYILPHVNSLGGRVVTPWEGSLGVGPIAVLTDDQGVEIGLCERG